MNDATLFVNGRILVGNSQSYAQALAVQDGLVAAAGTNEFIQSSFPLRNNTIDLGGATVWPGLTDSHLHLRLLGERLAALDCEGLSLFEIIQHLRSKTASTKPNEWILGFNWNQNEWDPPVYGTKEQLDSVSADCPVVLYAKSLHASWVNSKALALAGVTRDTPDPAGGQILRVSNGDPSGILLENAMSLVDSVIPPASPEKMKATLLEAQQYLFSLGITGAHDFDRWEHLNALLDLETNGLWKLRVQKSLPASSIRIILEEKVRTHLFHGARVRPGWIKSFADGALGPQTAAMLEPFEGSTNLGLKLLSAQEILELGISAAQEGWPLAIHAIGDAANREVLDGFALLRDYETKNQLPRLPHRVEHAQLVHPADISRFRALDITASVQPIHAVSDMDMADQHWGNRCAAAYPYNSLMCASVSMIFGSDAPVESPNPFLGIHAAVTRQRPGTNQPPGGWHPEQRVSLAQALKAYTAAPSCLPENSNVPAGIMVGSNADLVVLDRDPFRVDPEELWQFKPLMTMVAGQVVYER